MLALKRVAVTGGLSCGKSSVCRTFKDLGAYVISADEIVHQLLSLDTNLGQEVIELLGDEVVVGNRIDRSKIAKLVFQDPELLDALEQLLHPRVYDEIARQYDEQQVQSTVSLFLAEVPLLFESKGEGRFDVVVSVFANPTVCKARFQALGKKEREYDKRMRWQIDPREKAKKADYVIINNGSLIELNEIVKELYAELTDSPYVTFE